MFKWQGYKWKCSMDGNRLIHPEYPWYWYSDSLNVLKISPENNLEFFIQRNPKDIKHWDGKTYHPIIEVATIRSIESFSFGTFSAEMMMPIGKNLSASFWLSGEGNWPPEIDIEEGWTEEKSSWFRWGEKYFPYFKPSWRTTTNMHFRDELMNKTHLGSRNIPYCKQPKDPSENWIEYKCKWEPKCITWYANGKIVRQEKGFRCEQMTKNLTDPEKGFRMNVIFNVWCENPDIYKIDIIQPMLVRNFKYTKL